MTQEDRTWVREYVLRHMDSMPRRRLAREAGLSLYMLYKVLRELGADVRKGKMFTEASREKLRKSRNRLIRMERRRILGGEPQKTRIYLNILPLRVRQAKRNLCKRRGYFCFRDEPYTLYYDGGTTRSPEERYFTEKYGLRFMEADDC